MSGKQIFGRGIPGVRGSAGSLWLDTSGGLPWAGVEAPTGTFRWARIQSGPQAGPRIFDDFLLDAGATLPVPWGKQDTSAAGSPTLDYAADAHGGGYVLKLDTTNEVEAITLYLADQLIFDATKRPIFACRLKIESDVTGAGGLFAAGDKLVFGLASARNATLDNVTTNAWFMAAGANHNVYTESDDGTTDTDDQDSGIDWVENTYADYMIDASDLTAVKFWINGAHVATRAIAAATGNLQPFIELQKAAAANKDHRVTVDWIDVSGRR